MGHKLVAAALTTLAVAVAGCTGDDSPDKQADPPETTQVPPSAGVPIDDTILDDGKQYIWREFNNRHEDQYMLAEQAGRGWYQLRIACLGGSMQLWIEGGSRTTVQCTGNPTNVFACNRKNDLISHAKWMAKPHWDYVWQATKLGDICREVDKDQA